MAQATVTITIEAGNAGDARLVAEVLADMLSELHRRNGLVVDVLREDGSVIKASVGIVIG